MRVAPVVGVLGVARPLVGDADAAGHADLAVGDQQLSVRAVVHAPDRVGLGRAEVGEGHARVAHLAHERAVHLRAADRIEQDVDLDAAARRRAQRVGHLAGDLTAPVQVGEEVQRALGVAHRLDHGREDLVAVDEQLDRVAVRDRRHRERLGRAQELVRADLDRLPAQLVALALLAAMAQRVGRVARDEHGRDRRRPAVVHGPVTSENPPSCSVKWAGSQRQVSPSTLKPWSPSMSSSIVAPRSCVTSDCLVRRPARMP